CFLTAALCASIPSATSRLTGRMTASTAGVFKNPGSPTIAPHKLGTTVQSSYCFGLIPSRRPITPLTVTTSAAAGYASGRHALSAISSSHALNTNGIIDGSRAGTGASAGEIGLNSLSNVGGSLRVAAGPDRAVVL